MDKIKPTLKTTEGPYYKKNSPERANLYENNISGEKLLLTGYVFNAEQKPVAGAWLDFWQADGEGKNDKAGYVLRGHQFADASGKYSLETVVPGAYPGRTPHIHVKVRSEDDDLTLTTQLFLPGLKSNSTDPIFHNDLLVGMTNSPEGKTATFNFVLGLS